MEDPTTRLLREQLADRLRAVSGDLPRLRTTPPTREQPRTPDRKAKMKARRRQAATSRKKNR